MSKIDELILELCPQGVEFVEVGDICQVFNGFAFKAELFNSEFIGLPLIRIRDVNTGFSDTFYSGEYDPKWLVSNGDILIGMDGDFRVTRWKHGTALLNQRVCRLQDFSNHVLPGYLFHKIQDELDRIHSGISGSTVKHLSSRQLEKSRIPLPPLEIQREIEKILDTYLELEGELEDEREARRKQYQFYRDALLSFPDQNGVRWLQMDEVVKIRNGRDYKNFAAGEVPVYGSGGIMTYVDTFAYDKPSVLIPRKGSLSNVFFVNRPFWTVDTIFYTEINEQILVPRYFYHLILSLKLEELNQAGGVPTLTQGVLNKILLPIPSIDQQQRIADVLDAMNELAEGLEIGLPAELSARRKQYDYYRYKLLTFKELAA